MRKARPVVSILAVLAVVTLAARWAPNAAAQALSPEVLKAFNFRSIGPTHQSGRFVDFAVPELEPATIYAATGSGGLWKSMNNGITWEPIFDNQPVISIGDVEVAPSNASIVWVGTGEHTSSRSTYFGDGVYKSTDAGKTWTNMGLKDTQHIGRLLIDPKDPNIVYVAALGHLFSENDERGVFKTIDGGKTWTKSLDVKIGNRAIGACDLVMDPKNPKILYAATYDKERKPWTFNLAGPGSAIYKTIDAGKTWTKLTGGLPGGMLGRIGLTIFLRNPLVLYANIENGNKPGMSDADREKELRESKSSDGMIGEEVYRTDDGGKTWKKVSADKQKVGGGPGYYYMQIRVDPNDVNHLYVLSVGVLESKDGGKTWASPFRFGGDNHAMWIDPANSKHMMLGYDHGMGVTFDAGKNWYHPDDLPLGQVYELGFDNQMPYNVYAGLQDNGSVRGPSSKRGGRITFEDWQTVGGGDGTFNVMDTVTNRYLYNESQFGALSRTDLYTGESKGIGARDQALRHNWEAPIVVSPHDPNVLYHAANKVEKSIDRGETWTEISPDLTTNDKTKLTVGTVIDRTTNQMAFKGGDGNIEYCTITTLAESPIVRDVLYAGTDDGNVWVTKDGGKAWTKLNDNVKGNPGFWVSRVVPSAHFPGTAYLAYTGYRQDDFRPFLYKTTDYGQTWAPIVGNLPNKPINVIREDPRNPNLLFVGMSFGLYVSIDGGKAWTEMKGNMPTQPVHDLQIHPRDHELIVGTHGRGIFVTDIAPLEELDASVLAQDIYLFDVNPAVRWVNRRANVAASINYNGPSRPNGVVVSYYQKAPAAGEVLVQVLQGVRVVAETKGPNVAGLNQVLWNMTVAPVVLNPAAPGQGGRGGGGGGRGGGAGQATIPSFGGAAPAPLGDYTIVIKAGNKTLTKRTQILEDVWFDKVF
jgi:photosystem II stability/assembly factor-like uncharacterized protein